MSRRIALFALLPTTVQRAVVTNCTRVRFHSRIVPSVAEFKARESDASARFEPGDSPVRAPVRAATLCPYV